MAALDADLWRRLAPILDHAFELPLDRRTAFLVEACGGDAQLRQAAEWLLASNPSSSFLEAPVEVPSDLQASLTPSGTVERFLPGTLLSDRYRIISLLGRGGMGEVYRADDLRLGQQVALKFLPVAFQSDPILVERLHHEVRTARQVSHPNVCRVWDVGEHEGTQFISMEYVDGESLASLLRRIGRLPLDKALDVSRQLCAGLAAAHDQGVLHRDLKPGNVMLDSRGRVRIADFGIAQLAEEISGGGGIAGTPGYMAPEQLAGGEVTFRSDIYSLGAILYEVVTGRRAFVAATLAEYRSLQEESWPPSPSRLVDGLDPAIERAIVGCLARDPDDRPASLRAVAAALPLVDLLDAALALGETPSPDLVAASGPREALSPRMILALGIGWLAALAALVSGFERTSILGRVPYTQPPAALAAHARETLASLGYAQPPADVAYDLFTNGSYLSWLVVHDSSADRWASLSAPGSLGMAFWYRESAGFLDPKGPTGIPQMLDDPPFHTGDALILSDLRGKLRLLQVIPPDADFSAQPAPSPDWAPLFTAAGLSPSDFEPAAPTRIPPAGFDARVAWSGVLPDAGALPIRVEAAAWRGRPVYFECIYPSDPYWSAAGVERAVPPSRLSPRLWTAWLLLLLGAGGLFVLRNLRLGRGDRRGAFRLASAAFAARLCVWVFGGHHVPAFWPELGLLAIALAWSLCVAAVVWAFYIALEPTVRRLWPQRLVGWSRLLAGRHRDPIVGRDLLIGSLVGLLFALAWSQLHILLAQWLGTSNPPPPLRFPGPLARLVFAPRIDTLLGGRFVAAGLMAALLAGLYGGLALTVFLLGWRLILRRDSLVAIGVVAFATFLSWPAEMSGYGWSGIVAGLVGAAGIVFLYVRVGLLAATVAMVVAFLYSLFPMTADVSAPYFGTGLIGALAAAGLGLWGAVNALGNRRLFTG
jgi:serine/threonine-protein kinase